jgi:hypothetical protein
MYSTYICQGGGPNTALVERGQNQIAGFSQVESAAILHEGSKALLRLGGGRYMRNHE